MKNYLGFLHPYFVYKTGALEKPHAYIIQNQAHTDTNGSLVTMKSGEGLRKRRQAVFRAVGSGCKRGERAADMVEFPVGLRMGW